MDHPTSGGATNRIDDAVRALTAHDDRLRALIDGMGDGFVLQDRNGAIQFANPAAERILGWSSRPMSERSLIDPRCRALRRDGSAFDRADHPASIALRTGKAQLGVVMGLSRDDRPPTWISIDASPLFDDDAKTPGRVVLTFRDVTEQKREHDELGRNRVLLHAVLENLPAGYYVFDETDGRVLAFNALFCAIWNLNGHERALRDGSLDHRGVIELVRAQLVEPAGPVPDTADARGGTLQGDDDVAMLTRDGRTIRRHSKCLVDEFGSAMGRLFLFEDVTREVSAEEERRTIERRMAEVRKLESLGVLAGGIAHDFNNLLTSIVGSAELAAQDAGEGTALRRQMERVIEAADRATGMCRRMLSYAGADNAPVRRVHLSDLVFSALRWLQPQITTRTRLIDDLAVDLPSVLGDPIQLNQVVVNLVANACESLPDGEGTVRVTTGAAMRERGFFAHTMFSFDLPAGEYVHVEVSDDGCGIDASVLTRMFDPFFSTKVSGRGLGLSAVLGIVRSHRGAIHVDSRAGGGTVMRVYLPTASVVS